MGVEGKGEWLRGRVVELLRGALAQFTPPGGEPADFEAVLRWLGEAQGHVIEIRRLGERLRGKR